MTDYNLEQFIVNERIRVEKLFSSKHKNGFENKVNFANWYIQKIEEQNFECFYCNFPIFKIRQLIIKGKLKTRKTGYGERGPVFEIDRKENPLGYNSRNCVLSCYYCNNDKSYTLGSEDYKKYFGTARKAFFEHLFKGEMLTMI